MLMPLVITTANHLVKCKCYLFTHGTPGSSKGAYGKAGNLEPEPEPESGTGIRNRNPEPEPEPDK